MDEIKPLPGVLIEPIEGVPARTKRKRPAKTPEGKVKDEVKAFLDHIGAFWSMPSQNGRGDRMVDFIGVWRSAAIAIETKKPGDDATDKQKDFLNRWRERGGWAFTADSREILLEQWSAECRSCGIKPPAICSMRGQFLREQLGVPIKRSWKADSSNSPAMSASQRRSAISKCFTSTK